MVKKKIAGSHGQEKIYTREGSNKREITSSERALTRDGQLGGFHPECIRVFLNGGWSFGIDDAWYMALLPPTARLSYAFDLYPKGGTTHALLDQTMICGQSVAAMTRDVGQLYAHEQTEAMLKYAGWTGRQNPVWGKFPAWGAVGDGTVLSAPTVANMETYANARYQEVKADLKGEMRSRGAKVISWDGTFATAKRVKGGANVLICLLNEHSHVVSYVMAPSEKWTHVLPMMMGFRDRLNSMGTLDDLTIACSDTCCDRLNNPMEHVTRKVFTGL
ncbi:unnamed protein product, partial [Ectocarpus sp. 13 AM-2016]